MTSLKNWMMITLAAVFVVLYTGALLGWLKPLSDVTMVMRLEPIIFIIIGYYFGRLPAQQTEQTLKEEISRQIKKADAAQHSREQSQQEMEAIEERLKNVKAVLMPSATRNGSARGITEKNILQPIEENNFQALQQSVKAAVSILNS